jgi:hypothetical protein
VSRLEISDQVPTLIWDPVNQPWGDLIGVDVELVDGIERILFGLITINLVQLLQVYPIVFPYVEGEGKQAQVDLSYQIRARVLSLEDLSSTKKSRVEQGLNSVRHKTLF